MALVRLVEEFEATGLVDLTHGSNAVAVGVDGGVGAPATPRAGGGVRADAISRVGGNPNGGQ
jgi:hypothetical protein